jgi:hypothetical protein
MWELGFIVLYGGVCVFFGWLWGKVGAIELGQRQYSKGLADGLDGRHDPRPQLYRMPEQRGDSAHPGERAGRGQ